MKPNDSLCFIIAVASYWLYSVVTRTACLFTITVMVSSEPNHFNWLDVFKAWNIDLATRCWIMSGFLCSHSQHKSHDTFCYIQSSSCSVNAFWSICVCIFHCKVLYILNLDTTNTVFCWKPVLLIYGTQSRFRCFRNNMRFFRTSLFCMEREKTWYKISILPCLISQWWDITKRR